MKKTFFAIILFLPFVAKAAGDVADYLFDVGVKWDYGCATLKNGQVVRMKLDTYNGRAEYSTALAAFSAGKKLKVYFKDTYTDNTCNVVRVYDHGMVRIVNE